MDVYIRGHTTDNFIKSCCIDFVSVNSLTSKARFEQFPELSCCRLLENCACRDIHVYPEMSLVTASQDVCGIRNVYGCISFMQISKKVQMRQGPDCVDNSFSPPGSMTWSENFNVLCDFHVKCLQNWTGVLEITEVLSFDLSHQSELCDWLTI